MYRTPRLRTVALLASLALGAACSTGPTETELLPTTQEPMMDGIGWVGGGGRSDSTAVPSSTGTGWFGGGGRSEQDTVTNAEPAD
jgi:hypothetical protein